MIEINKNHPKSLAMLTLSMIIFGSIGIFRRFIPLSSAALAGFRGTAGALFLFIVAKMRGIRLANHIGGRKVLWLVITGAVMGFNWILLFEAYNYTSVATATLCYYMQPTIVILLAPIFLHDKLSLKKGVCVLLSLIGMIFVSGIIESGMPEPTEARGILFGLGAALLYAVVVMMNKAIPGIDAYEKTIIQLLSAAVFLIPYLLLAGQMVTGSWTGMDIFMLLIVGIIHTGIAYMLYFGSMDGLKTQTVAIFSYLDPITALILSALILHESMSVFGMFGALLIIGAALISEIELKKQV
ncbi:MAG: DMT family transporter [Eubacterium sp.]|nr:DMT family transporter [Eubacterium sp.]